MNVGGVSQTGVEIEASHIATRGVSNAMGMRWLNLLALWLIFCIAAFGFSRIPGINEPHYLAKARAFAEPDWCQRDFFLQSANAHFIFYVITGPLTQIFSLTTVAIIGRIGSMFIFSLGWSRLARSLQLSDSAILFSAAAFVCFSQAGNFSGEWILGGFESKVPAFGFVLLAISLLTETVRDSGHLPFRATVFAGVCLGLATALHPVVGGWTLLATSGALCLTPAKNGSLINASLWLKRLLVVNVVAVLVALPGLIPAVQFLLKQTVSKADSDLANFYQVFWRLRHHLDPMEIPRSGWNWLIGLLVCLGIVVVCLRWLRSSVAVIEGAGAQGVPTLYANQRQVVRFLGLVLLVSCVIAAAGVAIGWHTVPATELQGWQWRASLLKFYPFRLFDALLPITTALATGALTDALKSRFSVSNRAPDAVGVAPSRWTLSLLAGCCAAVSLAWVWSESSEVPAGYTATQIRDWLKACEWIQNHAPEDALFLTPRESFAFKWFAERAEFVCYKDCPQDAAGILEWNRRLWFLHDWTLQSSQDNLYSREELQALKAETGITHLVTRILGPFEDPPMHREGDWMIIAIP